MPARCVIGPPPQSRRGLRPESSLAGRGSLSGLNSVIPQGEPAGSSLARFRTALGRANPAWGLSLRHYRVSHLGAETAEDNLEVARGDRGRAARLAGGLHVVLVVRPGDGAVLAAPAPAVLSMSLPLAGRGRAGPLPGAQPGMGNEQRLAEGATLLAAPSPRGTGHEVTSRQTVTLQPRPCEGETSVRWLGSCSGVMEAGLSMGRTGRRELTHHQY
jgi:hypothetical protein